MNKTHKRQKVLFGTLLAVLLVGVNTIPAYAAVGDVISTVSPSNFIDSSGCSVGLSFDGTHLYWDNCASGSIWISDTASPTVNMVDVRDFSAEIPELPNAMAFDAIRGVTYVATQSCDGAGNTSPVYEIDHQGTLNNLQDDTVTKLFSAPLAGNCFIDGLAYNQNDPIAGADAIYISGDAQSVMHVLTLGGVLMSTIDTSLIAAGAATTSGVAVGGTNIYLANDGGGDVFRATLPGLVLVDQFVSADERQEDMECDPITFAVQVMWLRTTPQGGAFPNVATAFEIEPDTCMLGGGDEMVGGEFLPINTAALLLAGLQSSAIWMLPVLAGAAGVGAFYIRTRMNKE